jgi:hypothetical protein
MINLLSIFGDTIMEPPQPTFYLMLRQPGFKMRNAENLPRSPPPITLFPTRLPPCFAPTYAGSVNPQNVNKKQASFYIKATEFATEHIKSLPLLARLPRKAHAVLMQGVRRHEKSPGEFRTSQNWIDGQGSALANVQYIPQTGQEQTSA